MSSFPIHRPRRLRRTEALRGLVRETVVRPQDLVLPLFVIPGTGVRRPVSSMPGVFNTSVDEAVRDAREAFELGIPAVLLFGIPPHSATSLADDLEVPSPERATVLTTKALR